MALLARSRAAYGFEQTMSELLLASGSNSGAGRFVRSYGDSCHSRVGLQAPADGADLVVVRGEDHEILCDRGVSFSFEDKLPWQWGYDRDFNDVIVTLTPAAPTLSGFGIAPAAAQSALADSGAAAPAQSTSARSASTSSRAAVRSVGHRQSSRAV